MSCIDFINSLQNINSMTDIDLYKIISANYQTFLSENIYNPNLKFLRKNTRFINILSQVLMERDLTKNQRIYCNSMIYTELSEIDGVSIKKVYYILGLIVNQDVINKLLKIGLDKALSIYLSVVSESSFDIKDNISRLNFTILCSQSNIMTTQKITDIYCSIFDTISEVRDLFLITLRDINVLSSDNSWVTQDVLNIYNNMNYAILSLLESLNLDTLVSILREYANMNLIEDITEEDIRFSFKSIDPNQFPNIVNARDQLANDGLELL